MDYRTMMWFQKTLFINVYIFIVWLLVTGCFLVVKFGALDHLTRYLSVAVYTLLLIIEPTRLYLGHYGNLANRVPELAGFLMLTVLMQLPLLSFFVFNQNLLSTPTEVTLHTMFWMVSATENLLCFLCLKKASAFAKSVYLSHPKRY